MNQLNDNIGDMRVSKRQKEWERVERDRWLGR